MENSPASQTAFAPISSETLLSQTIAWVRFPLIVLVVMIHVSYGLPETQKNEDFPLANMICENFVQSGVASIAVPLFFFISGFLYFYKTDWSVSAYGKKLRSRVRTLLVPFLAWSALAISYLFLTYKLGLTRSSMCADLSALDWLKSVYGVGEAQKYPLVFQFWFLRDLIIVGLFTPQWHLLLKNRVFGTLFLCALAAIWIGDCGWQLRGFSTTAVFFFCAGAYFSIHGRDFAADFSKFRVLAPALYLPVLVADALTKSAPWNVAIHRFGICLGIVATVSLVRAGIAGGKLREIKFLSEASFFVYALHGMAFFKGPYSRVLDSVYAPGTNAELIAVFFLRTAFEIAVCLGAYWILRRAFLPVLRFLTGGR